MKKIFSICALWGMVALVGVFSACGSRDNRGNVSAQFNSFGSRALDKYRTDTAVHNVVLVQCLEGSQARVQMYHKDDSLGTWSRVIDTDGCIGRNGFTSDKKEGDGMSPIGDFGLLLAFGIKPDPGASLSYLRVTPDTYAIDGEGEYYNRIVDAKEAGTTDGEEMYAYSPEYNYGLALDYNLECVPGAGSNIFFHCKGAKPATGGCVAVDEEAMKAILLAIQPRDRVCIYPLTIKTKD